MRNKLEKYTRKAIALLSPDAEAKKHFAAELDWLEERLAIWQKQEWRVALIGITSSGKSTLVNALLDDQLLPVRVRPTSNSLVICRRGDEPQAVVHYHGKPTEVISHHEIGKRLKHLTDEKSNPDNKLGVKEIELVWPRFRLGDGVALIDTPGLDAYQLERHEKLTMHLLLPTVDAVCFLTTAKANSDGRIASYLDIIGAHGKPLVVVQNMIDSIETKLGIGGSVERTKAEVAEDHLNRLRKLLAKLSFDAQNTPILQVSAHWALEGKLGKSGISDLVQAITAHLERLQPRLFKGRYQQLHNELSKIATTESSAANLAVSKKRMTEEMNSLKEKSAAIARHLDDFSSKLSALATQNHHKAAQLKVEANGLSRTDVREAKNFAERFNWFAAVPSKLGDCTLHFQNETQRLASVLNLTTEDLQFKPMRGPNATRVSVPVIEKTEGYWRDKEGISNWLKRGWGWITGSNAGREYVSGTSEQIDVPAFKKSVEEHLAKESGWLERTTTTLKDHAEKFCSPLQAELARRQQSLDARIASQVAAEQRIAIASDLKNLCETLATTIAAFPDAAAGSTCHAANGLAEAEGEVHLPKYMLELVRVAHRVSSRRYLMLRNEVLRRIADHLTAPPGQFLIWGFDGNSMDQFLSRFWFDMIFGTLDSTGSMETVDTTMGKIAVVLDSADDNADLLASVKDFSRNDTVCFLMLDLEQPGSTMNRLNACGLLPLLNTAAGIILVVQGLRGLENSGQVAAGVCALKKITQEFHLTVDGVLVNHEKDVASVIVDRLYMRGEELRTIDDEQSWLADLDGGDSAYVSGLLRAWRDELREEVASYA